ncbi:hypothetical protein JCM10908_001729 [Rhodotorula pacifica]|uniref:uncharacterized protein n=1 Tax=Rhodotorula pacifica TaxID=1495444 RepID=UPI00317AC3D3
MSYRANAGSAPRPMNPPMLSSRPAQPANTQPPTPPSALSQANASAGRSSPVLVRQPQPSSFESQPTSQPRPAPQPPSSSLSSSQGQSQSAMPQRPPPLTLEESKQVARTHHAALKRWLAQEGALNSASTRTNAREKLTRLTRQQFQELSTDVYDELMRRLQDSTDGQQGQHGFLAVRPDFHPKRNQARQKLATLPITRFRDLGSDVYFELDRRYPEFNEERETVEPLRSPTMGQGFQQQQQQQYRTEPTARGSPQLSRDGSLASSHSHSLSGAGQQQQPQQSAYHAMRQGSSSPSPAPPPNLNAQRRAPTPTSTGTSSPNPANASLPPAVPLVNAGAVSGSVATPTSNDIVVPNKSTMRVEDPPRTGGPGDSSSHMSPPPSATSSHFAAGSTSTSPSGQTGPPSAAAVASAALARSGSSTSNQFSPQSQQQQQQQQQYSPTPSSRQLPQSSTGSPSLSQVAQSQPSQNQNQNQAPSPGFTQRASEASSTGMMSRFVGAYGAGGSQYAASQAGASEAGRGSWDQNRASSSEQVEQVRASYEYKLTMLQNRIAELENAAPRSAEVGDSKERLRLLEQQLDEHERRIRTLQEENSSLRSVHSTPAISTTTASVHSRADSQFRARLHEAEELASELRGEVSALVDEVRSANERADELQAELEREREAKEKVEQEATSWKERYQQAKVELRNIKATSQLFTSSISPDADFMPASADGLVSDSAVGTFQTSIDDLLQAARSKEPSNVFTAAHAVVRACEALDKDVQAIPPSRLASFPPQEQDHISNLKGNINATLSNLMTASKNHATSFGVLPVSLVDAAASHLAQAVVELVRVLKIRRTTGSGPSTPQRNGFSRNEPMPPLPENATAQIAQRSNSLNQRGQPQSQQQQRAQSPAGKAQGYFSGGLSSVKHALETIGLSSPTTTTTQGRELPSSRSIEDRLASGGAGEPQSGFSTSSAQSHQQSYDSHSASSSATGYLHSPPPASQQRQTDHSSFSTATSLSSPPHMYQSDEQFRQMDAPSLPNRSAEHSDWRRDQPPEQQQQLPRPVPQPPVTQNGSPSYSQPGAGGHSYDQQYGYDRQQEPYGQQGMSPRAPYDAVPSPTIGGQERAPEELRAYVENQTELIVHSIQSLLSAIRSGASASELNDSLNQIITIVSSIVGISQQALPATDAEADQVLQDLTTHCDKLSVMQSTAGVSTGDGSAASQPTFSKHTKQAMAAASFGVAKSLKQLNGLLNGSNGGGSGNAGPDSLT